MTDLATAELEAVTGGTTKDDQALELALTKLQSDIKDLARPQSTSQQLLPLMAMVVASRR
jgi:hypothetical protein